VCVCVRGGGGAHGARVSPEAKSRLASGRKRSAASTNVVLVGGAVVAAETQRAKKPRSITAGSAMSGGGGGGGGSGSGGDGSSSGGDSGSGSSSGWLRAAAAGADATASDGDTMKARRETVPARVEEDKAAALRTLNARAGGRPGLVKISRGIARLADLHGAGAVTPQQQDALDAYHLLYTRHDDPSYEMCAEAAVDAAKTLVSTGRVGLDGAVRVNLLAVASGKLSVCVIEAFLRKGLSTDRVRSSDLYPSQVCLGTVAYDKHHVQCVGVDDLNKPLLQCGVPGGMSMGAAAQISVCRSCFFSPDSAALFIAAALDPSVTEHGGYSSVTLCSPCCGTQHPA
jgi:hypothetical protein